MSTILNSLNSSAQGVSNALPDPSVEELRDIQGFFAIEVPAWLWISLIVLAVAALGYFIYVRYLKKSPDADLTIFQLTVKRLKELDPSKNSKDFYLAYSEYVRTFLEQRLSMHALDRTVDEMRELLIKERRIQTSQAMSLSKILQRADLAKFALYTVPIDAKAKDIELTIEIIRSIEDVIVAEEQLNAQNAALNIQTEQGVTNDIR